MLLYKKELNFAQTSPQARPSIVTCVFPFVFKEVRIDEILLTVFTFVYSTKTAKNRCDVKKFPQLSVNI